MSAAKSIAYIVIGILIIAVVGILASRNIRQGQPSPISYPTTSPASSGATLIIQLTDPPVVPQGTTSLEVNYSGVVINLLTSSGTVSLRSNQSGSIDLLSIVNLSTTIGRLTIPKGSAIRSVELNVTHGNITINGTSYPLVLSKGNISFEISSPRQVNGSSILLLDLSPVVATIYTNTSPVYVLVPSLRAIVLSNVSSSKVQQEGNIGAKASINATEREELERERANISIVNASLSNV
ncbi:MAG: hypothetical protein QXL16_00985, partial [Candidatus Micrarchaeaceae archaeon]